MTSEERAARLKLVPDEEADRIRAEEHAIAASRRLGSWRWSHIGGDLQLRSKSLPTMRLDLLRSEAVDLMRALAKALDEKLPKQPRLTKTQRKADTAARKRWNKAHEIERAYALKQMAEEFAASGGWQ
jgi:hypothetical protein